MKDRRRKIFFYNWWPSTHGRGFVRPSGTPPVTLSSTPHAQKLLSIPIDPALQSSFPTPIPGGREPSSLQPGRKPLAPSSTVLNVLPPPQVCFPHGYWMYRFLWLLSFVTAAVQAKTTHALATLSLTMVCACTSHAMGVCLFFIRGHVCDWVGGVGICVLSHQVPHALQLASLSVLAFLALFHWPRCHKTAESEPLKDRCGEH